MTPGYFPRRQRFPLRTTCCTLRLLELDALGDRARNQTRNHDVRKGASFRDLAIDELSIIKLSRCFGFLEVCCELRIFRCMLFRNVHVGRSAR